MTWWFFKRFLFSRRTGALVRVISWLCIAGIGMGVFSLILVMSVMNGFNQAIRDRLLSFEPHLVVTFRDEDDARKWNEWQSRFLVENPAVSTYAFEQQDVILKTVDGYFGGAQARGVSQEFLDRLAGRMSGGGEPEPGRWNLQEDHVLIGSDLARSLQIFEEDPLTAIPPEGLLLPPGEAPKFVQLHVAGFISTFISNIDGHIVYYLRGRGFRAFGRTASLRTGVEIQLPDPMAYASYQRRIRDAGFSVESWKDRNSALFRALLLERTLIGTFLILSTIIASFSIVTVLALLATQKRKEFGILMSMGLSAGQTQKLFAKLGILLSACGLGGGILAGTLLSLYIEKYPLNLLPNIYQDSRIPALVDYHFIFWVLVGSLIVSVLAAWYPSKKISRLLPAEALRGK